MLRKFSGLAFWLFVVPAAWSQYEEIVETVVDIEDPVGVAYGVFNGKAGLFVSSFALHDVFFYTYDQLNKYSPVHHDVKTRIVSGGELDINIDGSFDIASFADPSRMSYDADRHVLLVASRLSMTIREVDFDAETVSTLSDSSGVHLTFEINGVAQFSDFPGLDIQLSNSNLYFVANSKKIYKIIRNGGSYSKVEFESVNSYFEVKNYPYGSSNIYSVAADNRNQVLYIAVSEAKNVILSVPFDRTNKMEPSYVSVVTGREDHTWGGIGTSFPSIVSGKKDVTTLGMPMHIQYDPNDHLLLWSEGVPLMDDITVGSLMLRALDLHDEDRTTSVLAGVNAFVNSPVDTSVYMGSTGGYVNGVAAEAAFKYPISMVYARSTNGNGVMSPELYVADRWNNAIRRVRRVVYTPHPTVTLTPTHAPTVSQRPTRHPTSHPTYSPVTRMPTRIPTTSVAPTYRFRPTLDPTEPNPPTIAPSSRPSHIHAISRPTQHPTRAPTHPLPVDIRYEDHSAFGSMGFGKEGISGMDIFLATCLGLLLAALLVMCLVMKDRADKKRARRKKKMVLRLDDDDSDDSDDDEVFEDAATPAGDVRPKKSGLLGTVGKVWSAASEYAAAAVGESSFDNISDTSSVHSDAHLMGQSFHSSSSGKSKIGFSRFFSKHSNSSGGDVEPAGTIAAAKAGASSSISSMLQKLKIAKRPQQNNSSNESFTTSIDMFDAPDIPGNSLVSDSSDHPTDGGRGASVEMYERPPRGGRSATGMAEGSVTRGGNRRSSGPDYL